MCHSFLWNSCPDDSKLFTIHVTTRSPKDDIAQKTINYGIASKLLNHRETSDIRKQAIHMYEVPEGNSNQPVTFPPFCTIHWLLTAFWETNPIFIASI